MQKKIVDNVLIITCNDDLDLNIIHDFSEGLTVLLNDNPLMSSIVFDFLNTYFCSNTAIRAMSSLALNLRKRGKYIYFINIDPEYKKIIDSMGLSDLFKVIYSLTEVPELKSKKKVVDVNFLNPFIDGTIETLKLQCSVECSPGKPFKRQKDGSGKIDIAGVIGITSSVFSGSISLCFPATTFLGLMSNMLGEEYTEINTELEDGAGELLNIIFGFAKRVLNEKGYDLEKAIPTIVRGNSLTLKSLPGASTFVLPFESTSGQFYIEISTAE